MKKLIAINACLALIVLLFAYTGSSKYIEHDKFVFQMELAPVPYIHFWAPVISWILPGLEILIAIGLLTERYRVKALYISVILLSLFEIYITIMLISGLHLPCTCGGIVSHLSWKNHLIFNAVFIGLAIVALRLIKTEHKKVPQQNGTIHIKDLSRA